MTSVLTHVHVPLRYGLFILRVIFVDDDVAEVFGCLRGLFGLDYLNSFAISVANLRPALLPLLNHLLQAEVDPLILRQVLLHFKTATFE